MLAIGILMLVAVPVAWFFWFHWIFTVGDQEDSIPKLLWFIFVFALGDCLVVLLFIGGIYLIDHA